MNKDRKTGFSKPQQAEAGWATELKVKHGFAPDASLEDMEQKATELLGSPRTLISGAELVLGRRVDARDKEVIPIIASPGLSARDRFGLLLLQKTAEECRARQGD